MLEEIIPSSEFYDYHLEIVREIKKRAEGMPAWSEGMNSQWIFLIDELERTIIEKRKKGDT